MVSYKCKPHNRKYKVLRFADVTTKQDILDFCEIPDDFVHVIMDGIGFTATCSYILNGDNGNYQFGPGCVMLLTSDSTYFTIISEDAFQMLFNNKTLEVIEDV